MSSFDFNALLQQAQAEGFNTEILVGEFDVEVASTSVGASQGGKPQVGVRLKVLGPDKVGASFWDNLTLSTDNPKAMAVFFRKITTYGVPEEVIKSASSLEQLVAYIPAGKRFKVSLGVREYNGKQYQDVKTVKAVDGQVAAVPFVQAAPVAPAPAPVAAPVVAPAPAPVVAPAPVAAPAPVVQTDAVPTAPVAPGVPF